MIGIEGFEALLRDANVPEDLTFEKLEPFLASDSLEVRTSVNFELAKRFLQSVSPESAEPFIDRAILFYDFGEEKVNGWDKNRIPRYSEEMLHLFVEIKSKLGKVEDIRRLYRRIGAKFARSGDVKQALDFFNMALYADVEFGRGDYYVYDYDILHYVQQMARARGGRYNLKPPKFLYAHRKIRVACLVYGIWHAESVLVRILANIYKFWDKDRFDFKFFVYENASHYPNLAKVIEENKRVLADVGADPVYAQAASKVEAMLETAHNIRDFKADVVFTTAALLEYNHYYIVNLLKPPVLVGLQQGPPPQYVCPGMDWAISWTKHLHISAPANSSFVVLEKNLPSKMEGSLARRRELGIPEDAPFVVCVGRYVKFRDRGFVESLLNILRDTPRAYLMLVGLDKEPDFLAELESGLTAEERSRFIKRGFAKDYLSLLSLADLVIDTYPSGGGVVVMDAMSMEIPVLSFRDSYFKTYDQTDWSLAQEFLTHEELLLPRGDFEELRKRARRILADESYRRELGRSCRTMALAAKGHPERMAKRCQDIVEQNFRSRYEPFAGPIHRLIKTPERES
ncbi:MAG: glycosyltransferase [Bdellovibrionales bacterium]